MVKEILEMIDFLLIRKYTPYSSLGRKLNKTDWKVWSWDIIWKLNDAQLLSHDEDNLLSKRL